MKRIWTILYLVCSCYLVKAQEDDFSQYLVSALYMNPAYASAYTDLAVSVNYKLQTTGEIPIQTAQVSLVFPIKLDNISDNVAGFGISAFSQDQHDGFLTENGIYLTYAQNFSLGLLGSDLIAVGIQGGYARKAFSPSNFKWGSQYSAYVNGGFNDFSSAPITEFDNSSNKIAVHAGAMYYYNRKRNYLLHNYSAFSGIAIYNINRPNDSFSKAGNDRQPIILKYHGGVEVRAGNLYILPNALLYYSRGKYAPIVGSHFALSFVSTARFTSANQGFQLLFGSWYRLRESFSFMGGLQYNALAIRASMDMNSYLFVPNNAVSITPSYEISLIYQLGNSGNLRKINNALF
ncbi:MAG: PorP/SprF family type IX secretion system membrane protein [Bacteroidota bacterium]